MKKEIENFLKSEIELFDKSFQMGHHVVAQNHLSRAHILSQGSVFWHLYIHYRMLGYALQKHDLKEMLGQLLRLAVTVPGHMMGRVPRGNIGWSKVGLTQELSLPSDIENILKKNGMI